MKKKVRCSNCNFTDEFEPCEFGLTAYQADGTCPCGGEITYLNGTPTKTNIEFKVIDNPENKL